LTTQNPRPYVIRETKLGREGLALCRAETPDCILLNNRLPDMDGLEFVAELKAQFNSSIPPIVMLSGPCSADMAVPAINSRGPCRAGWGVRAMKSGVKDYLVKEALTAEGLGRAVHNAMDKVALENKIDEQRRELEALAAERACLIAELQQRASALTEVDRRKDEFLAMLAHELRNPLSPIVNGLYLLRQVKPNSPAAEGALAMVERQVQRITRLVDDLLDVARITSGKIILQKKPVDLARVVESAVETSRPLLNERGHQFTVCLPTEPVLLAADPV